MESGRRVLTDDLGKDSRGQCLGQMFGGILEGRQDFALEREQGKASERIPRRVQ